MREKLHNSKQSSLQETKGCLQVDFQKTKPESWIAYATSVHQKLRPNNIMKHIYLYHMQHNSVDTYKLYTYGSKTAHGVVFAVHNKKSVHQKE